MTKKQQAELGNALLLACRIIRDIAPMATLVPEKSEVETNGRKVTMAEALDMWEGMACDAVGNGTVSISTEFRGEGGPQCTLN